MFRKETHITTSNIQTITSKTVRITTINNIERKANKIMDLMNVMYLK